LDDSIALATDRNHRAVGFHEKRRLGEASALYAEVLHLDPPRQPTTVELSLIKKHTPILYVTPNEPLPLQDFAVVLHPEQPLIAYHMFWEDDIDYPDDNEPCDHEEVWVAYDSDSDRVTSVCTFYHSQLLSSQEAVDRANQRGGRPIIYVEWGRHGSLPEGWKDLCLGGESVPDHMQHTHERLHTKGRRALDHPLGHHWPVKFDGDWEDFVDFSHLVEPLEWIEAKGMVMVTRWCNAVIDQRFLRYNFCPKWEWPKDAKRGPIR